MTFSSLTTRPPRGSDASQKTRPVVVVSGGEFHSERPQDVVAALITTKLLK